MIGELITLTVAEGRMADCVCPSDVASSAASQVPPAAPSGGVTAAPSREESNGLSIINFGVGLLRP